jgi:hypothetical protein
MAIFARSRAARVSAALCCGARTAASARTAARPNEIYIYILEGFKYVFLCEYDLSCV